MFFVILHLASNDNLIMTSSKNKRHTARAENFENSLVVVTGFGQPSDATRMFFSLKMAQTKNALIRQRVIDRCLRSPKQYSIMNMMEKCNIAHRSVSSVTTSVKSSKIRIVISCWYSNSAEDSELLQS